jgi:hypothetical protein
LLLLESSFFYAGIGFQWKLTDLRGTPKSIVPEKKARPWPGGAVTSKSTLSCKTIAHGLIIQWGLRVFDAFAKFWVEGFMVLRKIERE